MLREVAIPKPKKLGGFKRRQFMLLERTLIFRNLECEESQRPRSGTGATRDAKKYRIQLVALRDEMAQEGRSQILWLHLLP